MAKRARNPVDVAASRTTSRELLLRTKAGDSQALDRLFARYIPRLREWAHRRVPFWARNAADTGDIVQDAVIHTMRHLHTFEPQHEGALLGYLRRALLNRVRDQFRHAARHPPHAMLEDTHLDAAPSPLEITIDQEDRRRYLIALKRLPAADRTAIIARIELGYSYEQLAFILNRPTAEAARLAVRRALLKLSNEMCRG